MKAVVEAIDAGQKKFAELPFFRRLEQPGSPPCLLALAPCLTFFTFVFQDILRLSEARMLDPALRLIASEHRTEEKGHEAWFLEDMEKLGLEVDFGWLFGALHRVTRDASYALVSEVFRTSDDRARIALLWVLEATGEVFFSRIPEYVKSTGYDGPPLDYFSSRHHEAERGHQIVDRGLRARMEAYALPADISREALGVVERAYEASTTMFTEIEHVIIRQESRRTPLGLPAQTTLVGLPR